MGENGAGKSTLGKILAGLITPDSGEIYLFGEQVHFRNPIDACNAGVSIVHQELIAFENLTVEENLAMESMPNIGPFVNFGQMRKDAKQWLENVHSNIDPATRLGDLPISQQQVVLIAGAVARGAKVVIFDESTSSLSNREAEVLFDQIRRLKASGVTCIYVSHRMEEIFLLCDTVSVLRDGKHVGTKSISELDRGSLVQMMIGRAIEESSHAPAAVGDTKLEVANYTSPGKFHDVNFSVKAGEIVGFAGLVGSGRSEIATAIFGLDRDALGTLKLNGEEIKPKSPIQMMGHKLGLVPEDRKRQGLVLMMNSRENITLPTLKEDATLGWVNKKREREVAQTFFQKLRVKAPSTESDTLGLSGGNQQKLVLAKWLAAHCDVLILDEPTRGVDVGAKSEIHDLIRGLAHEGKAVIVISSELPEVLGLATRILVVRDGTIVGEVNAKDATEESLLRLMTGVAAA
jgi:ABC-type sugar transport system ATPase subunit